MNKEKLWAERIFVIIGNINIIFAIYCFWYTSKTFLTLFVFKLQHTIQTVETAPNVKFPYFYKSFIVMSGICVLFHIMYLLTGIKIIRRKLFYINILVAVFVSELLYFFIIGCLWLDNKYGSSIAAASGIANGGLDFTILVLYPLWATPLLLVARKKYLRNIVEA